MKRDIFLSADLICIIYTDCAGVSHTVTGIPIRWEDEVGIEEDGMYITLQPNTVESVRVLN